MSINSDADLFCNLNGKGTGSGKIFSSCYVYQNALQKFYAIDSLIAPNDPNATRWSTKSAAIAYEMNDRPPSGPAFGQLVGRIQSPDSTWQCYLLTPRLP